MTTSGMARKVDDLGRIVLPVEMRRMFEIQPGDALEIAVENGGIVLRKVETRCVFCNTTDDLRTYRQKQLCAPCAAELGLPPDEENPAVTDASRAHIFDGLPTPAEFAEQLPSATELSPAAEELDAAFASEGLLPPTEVQSDFIDPPALDR